MRGAAAEELVVLDRDHPGFRDLAYRQRRNAIARLALEHRPGDPPPEVSYTKEEHGSWGIILSHLVPLHRRLACRDFLEGWPRLGFRPEQLPRFAEVNRVLQATTGFRLEPAPGLVTPRTFLENLDDGLFLATQYIRHPSAPLYTPEPDVVHELVGHAALLSCPRFARIHRLFGAAARAVDGEKLEQLIRAYWYTVEFGLARDGSALRVVGAGLLSSAGEMGRLEQAPTLRPFTLEAVRSTPYDPTDYQPVLFVAESTEQLLGELTGWLEGLILGR